MSEGRVAYLGSIQDSTSYFAKLGYVVPSNYNPSDFFIKLLAIVPGKEEQCHKRVKVRHFLMFTYK